jgi:hypothetical protein
VENCSLELLRDSAEKRGKKGRMSLSEGSFTTKADAIQENSRRQFRSLVSDLRNLRKYVASPSTCRADLSLRKQRKSDTPPTLGMSGGGRVLSRRSRNIGAE